MTRPDPQAATRVRPTRAPASQTGANPRAGHPTGTTCRRCGYDLRSLPTGGRCPECGLATALSRPLSASTIDAWQPISEGCQWIGNSVGALVLLFCFAPLSPTVGLGAIVLAMVHAWCHWFGLRDLRTGLAPAIADDPIFADDLRRATLASHVAVATLTPIGLAPLGSCVLGPSATTPGGFQVASLGIVVPIVFVNLVLSRRLAVRLADACAIRDAIPHEALGARVLPLLGSLVSLAWIAVAGSFLLRSPLDELLFGIALPSAILLGLPVLWLLWRQFDLFARVGAAVPQSTSFSEAARRVERQSRGPLTIARSVPRSEDDAPIPIADEPPPGDSRDR
jgi:hypothetical protein